jgi:hypothetical protein
MAEESQDIFFERRPSRSIVSFIGTLVNSDTTSKLLIISLGSTWRKSSVWANSTELLTRCGELPVWLLRWPAKCLPK